MDAEEFVDSFFDMDVDQCVADILSTRFTKEELIREYGEEVYYYAIKKRIK